MPSSSAAASVLIRRFCVEMVQVTEEYSACLGQFDVALGDAQELYETLRGATGWRRFI